MNELYKPCPFCEHTSRVAATFAIKTESEVVNVHGVLCVDCFGVVFTEPCDDATTKGKPPIYTPYNPEFALDKEDELVNYYNCPECEKFVSNNVDNKREFCAYCGQKLDWTGFLGESQ